jgi:phosphatidylglycerol:prolipoprotein diacylglycerol transferase
MRPELFRIFGISAPSYFVLLVSGFLFATAIGALWARRIGKDPDVVVDLGLAMLIAGVAGGRILHVLADGYFWDYVHLCTDPRLVDWHLPLADCFSDRYRGEWDVVHGSCHAPEADCLGWAKFWAGGLTYYGGFVGATIAAWYLLARDRFPFWKAADMAGFAIPVGLGFGRMGCLLAGCCFGVRTAPPLGLAFPPGSPASESQFKAHLLGSMKLHSLPVHATQLYEAAASLAVAAVCLLWLHGRKRYDGHVFVGFVVLYAVARFALELLRADDRGAALGLSTSQWFGVAAVAVALALHRRRMRALGLLASAPPAR